MQGSGESSVLMRMAEGLLVCERDIPIQQQRLDPNIYLRAFDSAKSKAQHSIQLQDKLGKLKGELREAEDALVKALSVKTRKEAKRMAMLESISAVKARVQELKGLVKDQRERKDQYATIMSQQYEALTACKEKCDQNRENKAREEVFSWYNRVLGFRIECGHGVKFLFTNINPENPNEEYFFIIRHANDTYTLLDCNPHLSDTKKLVAELNMSNGLFKFVRTMREKFQEAAAQGISLHSSSPDQASSIISVSAPLASVSTNPGFSSTPEKLPSAKSISNTRKVGKGFTVQSPGSASSLRRSSRLKGKN
ncbi:hypothetical protein ACS0TY_034874 [Phlomoides rotata]